MLGRKKKPHKLHVIQGTERPCRTNPRAPEAEPATPVAPDYLGSRAKKYFEVLADRIRSMGYLSRSHTEILALAALRLAEVDELTALIEREGPTYFTVRAVVDAKGAPLLGSDGKPMYSKLKKGHPAVSQRSEAMRHAQSLLAELGLSPSAMNKVTVPEAGDDDEWRKLLR
jgi:P27 family predicted phage terminase small subunit